VAIFAATLWEVQAVQEAFGGGAAQHLDGLPVMVYAGGSREYWLVQTGVGPEKARLAAARLFAHQSFSLAVSTGFACALITTEIGALLVGRDVVASAGQGKDSSPPVEVPGNEREIMLKRLAEGTGQPGHIGRFVSTDRIIPSAAEKRHFASTTAAIGLDMESAALATEAQRARVPFVIVRTVSDLLDEDLPLDFNLFLRPTGWLKGLAALIGNPSSLAGLNRLRRQSRAAAQNLTIFFRWYAQA